MSKIVSPFIFRVNSPEFFPPKYHRTDLNTVVSNNYEDYEVSVAYRKGGSYVGWQSVFCPPPLLKLWTN